MPRPRPAVEFSDFVTRILYSPRTKISISHGQMCIQPSRIFALLDPTSFGHCPLQYPHKRQTQKSTVVAVSLLLGVVSVIASPVFATNGPVGQSLQISQMLRCQSTSNKIAQNFHA